MAHTQTQAQAQAPAPVETESDRERFVLVARYKKARAIAKHLLTLGATAETAAELGRLELGRQLSATTAGTRVPSEVTWALVIELVREVRP